MLSTQQRYIKKLYYYSRRLHFSIKIKNCLIFFKKIIYIRVKIYIIISILMYDDTPI